MHIQFWELSRGHFHCLGIVQGLLVGTGLICAKWSNNFLAVAAELYCLGTSTDMLRMRKTSYLSWTHG